MTRISSFFVATAMAVLPISAFAQTAPAAPASVTGPAAATPTANVIQPATPSVKTVAPVSKTEAHSVNRANPHHAKAVVPAKTAAPAKS